MAMNLPSGRGRGNRRAPMAEINVTPMVDVMLVLLIIFMVTAPLMMAGVPVNLPDSNAKALEQQQEPVQISLDSKGQIFIGETQIDMATLPYHLSKISGGAGADAPQVYLRADTSLDYGQVMRVMGELNRAGLNKVALVSISGAAE
mgnify:CR=1 FL=1